MEVFNGASIDEFASNQDNVIDILDKPKDELRILLVGPTLHFAVTDVFYGYLNGLKNIDIDTTAIPTHQLFALLGKDVVLRYLHSVGMDVRNKYTHVGFIGCHGNCDWWILDSFAQLGIKSFLIITEDPHQLDQNEKWYNSVDYYFSNEKRVVDVFPNAKYLPTAGHPDYCKSLKYGTLDDKYKCDILFLGTIYKNRLDFFVELFTKLDKHNFKIIIAGMPLSVVKDTILEKYYVEPSALSFDGTRMTSTINHDDAVRCYNGAKIILNLSRDSESNTWEGATNKKYKLQGESLNPRMYEVPLCDGFLLTDNTRSEVHKVFITDGKGQNMVVYNDVDDCYNKILYYLDHDNERRLIAKRAFEHVIKNHTYNNRAARLAHFLIKDINPQKAAMLKLKWGCGNR